jgi:cob(I)alamin adenosyltransferase
VITFEERPMGKGLVVVFTGNGKGKTTSALGLALRALGHDYRVCMIQFVKGKWKSGEVVSARQFGDRFEIFTMGKGFIFNAKEEEPHREAALEAWGFAREIIGSSRYSIVILDELTYLLKYNMIGEKEVLDVLSTRPECLHIVITGRDAPASLIEAADMVTEMKEIKHPLNGGIKGQKGIEY